MIGDDVTASDHPLDDLPTLLAGELSPERDAEVADHLASCDGCRRELAVVAQMASWLTDAARLPFAEQVELPPLRMSDIERAARRSRGTHTRPARRRRILAAAAAIVVVAGGVIGGVVATSSGSPAPTAVVALRPVGFSGSAAVAVAGSAAMSGHGQDQQMTVDVHGLTTPADHGFYEVWLLNTRTNAMLSVGVLPSDGRGRYTVPAAQSAGYNAIDVSLEPDDGNAAHSSDSVLRGTIA